MSTEDSKAKSEEKTRVDQTRRALIRAGWVIPAILALELQVASTAFAQYGGGGGQGGGGSQGGGGGQGGGGN